MHLEPIKVPRLTLSSVKRLKMMTEGMLYPFICWTLLTSPIRSLNRIKKTCPSIKTLRGFTGETPIGCFCGGKVTHLPQLTRCYVPGSWNGTKYAPGVYVCTLGECDGNGTCVKRTAAHIEWCEGRETHK
ncbi:hypothetical protein V5799_021664 [Amblyomma americanum]|uniref:Uncharacterized protein n=1 Tax=Amblyomma americanum TaxID=6943 RepID=A0AAQ4FP77_AMBAM